MSKDLKNGKPLLASMDRLPDDITRNILTRLPIKSVFRCRAVRKPWRSLIDQPNFSIIHFNTSSITQTTATPSSSFIVLPVGTKRNLHIFEQGQNPNPKPLNITLDFHGTDESASRLYLVGSCNGLICLSSWCQSVSFDPDAVPASSAPKCLVYICNPTTGEIHKLPDVTPPNYVHVSISSGFGFDPSTKEFKVVMTFQISPIDSEFFEAEAHVFTLGSTSWRKLTNCQTRVYMIKDAGPGVFVNGSLHWVMGHDQGFFGIASFDVRTETFGVLPVPINMGAFTGFPPSLTGDREISTSHLSRIGVLQGCLCLTYFPNFGDNFEIWILKDYNVIESWTKQVDVNTKPIWKIHRGQMMSIKPYFLPFNVIHPVCFRENGELVLLCNNKLLVSYNYKKKKATSIVLHDESTETTFQALPYIRSLIPPKSACQLKRRNFEESNASRGERALRKAC